MKRFLTILLACLFGLSTFAADEAAKVKALNAKHKSIEYSFTEKEYQKVKGTTKNYKGTLTYTADKLSMIYSNPSGDKKVIGGGKYVQVRNGKAMQHALKEKGPLTSLCNMLTNSLGGNVQAIATENKASISATTEGTHYVFTLTMKVGMMKKLELKYNKTNGVLDYMKMTYSNGNTNEYVMNGTATVK